MEGLALEVGMEGEVVEAAVGEAVSIVFIVLLRSVCGCYFFCLMYGFLEGRKEVEMGVGDYIWHAGFERSGSLWRGWKLIYERHSRSEDWRFG